MRTFLPSAAVVLLTACLVRPATNLDEGLELTRGGRSSSAIMPTWEPSNEATADQLRLARDQGDAAEAAVQWLVHHAVGGQMPAGEYLVAYAFSAPRGYYQPASGSLGWHQPSGNAHLAVYVRDGADGRPVPGVAVRAELVAGAGPVETRSLPYGWAVLLDEYGDDVALPEPGRYTLRVSIAPPSYWRHDPVNGGRYTDSATAEFTDIPLDPSILSRTRAEDTDGAALALGQAQGAALDRAFYRMAHATATDGAQVRLGDYLLAYADEFAEGYWLQQDGKLVYNTRVEATSEHNAHIEVAVRRPIGATVGCSAAGSQRRSTSSFTT